jgi:hypothetical protein
MIQEALNRIEFDRSVAPRQKSIKDKIRQALQDTIYPALLETVHHYPTNGPSPQWAIRVISTLVEELMPEGNGAAPCFTPLRGKARDPIENNLDHWYDQSVGRYKSGYNDHKIAERCDVTIEQVIEIREARYGEMQPDPDTEAVEKAHQDWLNDINLSLAKFAEDCKDLEKDVRNYQDITRDNIAKLDDQRKEISSLTKEISSLTNINAEDQSKIDRKLKALHKMRDDINNRFNAAKEDRRDAIDRIHNQRGKVR